jgi:hypothetical protein
MVDDQWDAFPRRSNILHNFFQLDGDGLCKLSLKIYQDLYSCIELRLIQPLILRLASCRNYGYISNFAIIMSGNGVTDVITPDAYRFCQSINYT